MFTLHCKPLYAPTDITPPNAYPTLARLRRHTYQTCLIIKPIPWGKSARASFSEEQWRLGQEVLVKYLEASCAYRPIKVLYSVRACGPAQGCKRLEVIQYICRAGIKEVDIARIVH